MNKEEYEIINIPTIGRTMLNNKTKKIYHSEFEIIEEKNKQIDQLTNNWNELEEWLKSYIALFDNPDTFEEQTLEDLKEVLDKMKEIKEGNNESN